jgi:hypothetical protein
MMARHVQLPRTCTEQDVSMIICTGTCIHLYVYMYSTTNTYNRPFPNSLQWPRNNGSKSRLDLMFSYIYCILSGSTSTWNHCFAVTEVNSGKVYCPSMPLPMIIYISWEAWVAYWCERSPLTTVAKIRFPDSVSCELSLLLILYLASRVFLQVPPTEKINIPKFHKKSHIPKGHKFIKSYVKLSCGILVKQRCFLFYLFMYLFILHSFIYMKSYQMINRKKCHNFKV